MNKQQLEEILNNAPEGATHVSSNGVYYDNSNKQNFECLVWWCRGEEWIESSIDHITQSLSDLQTQLDQLNEIERLKSAITPEVIDFVRCGIGSNYSGKYYDEKIKSVHEPLVALLKELNK